MGAKKLEDVDLLFEERVNAGDIEGDVTGAAAVRDSWSQLLAAQPRVQTHVTKVVRVGDDLAVLYNEWSGSMAGPDGQPTALAGKATEVVRRQADGTWRFIVEDPWMRG